MEDLTALLTPAEWGLTLTPAQLRQFADYAAMLAEWNEKMNLTAITALPEVARKHFLDSLSLLQFTPPGQGAALIDVGSGAGFPGMVLKIGRPDIALTCMDGTGKRVAFLTALARRLGLTGVACLHARAEEAGRKPPLRAGFDVVTARAVAALPVLCEYCLPFARVGGRFLAMKGPDGQAEAETAAPALEKLGGRVLAVHAFTLPGTDYARTIVEIEKHKPTPAVYPRPAGKIKKAPL